MSKQRRDPRNEHQLLLTPGNVKLTRDAKKWETRRIIKPQPELGGGAWKPGSGRKLRGEQQPLDGYRFEFSEKSNTWWVQRGFGGPKMSTDIRCPYGKPGDILWVRETWQLIRAYDDDDGVEIFEWTEKIPGENPGGLWRVVYAADGHPDHFDDRGWRWRPNIFMPRWACRVLLKVNAIEIEQLHDITDAGAQAEGMANVEEYRQLWNEINGKKCPWEVNPWVFVVKYSQLESH